MPGLVPRASDELRYVFHDHLTDPFDDYFHSSFPRLHAIARKAFKMDVKEKETEYLVEAELPGIAKDDIKIEFDDYTLKIMVAKNESAEEYQESYICKERYHSSMQRTVYLPYAKADGIKATLTDGILYLTIQRNQKTNTSIPISID